jgi:hypothetical protein
VRSVLPDIGALKLEEDATGVAKKARQYRRCRAFRGGCRKLKKQLLERLIGARVGAICGRVSGLRPYVDVKPRSYTLSN